MLEIRQHPIFGDWTTRSTFLKISFTFKCYQCNFYSINANSYVLEANDFIPIQASENIDSLKLTKYKQF